MTMSMWRVVGSVLLYVILSQQHASATTCGSAGAPSGTGSVSTVTISAGATATIASITCSTGSYPISRFYDIWQTDNWVGGPSIFSPKFTDGTFATNFVTEQSCYSSSGPYPPSVINPLQSGYTGNSLSLVVTCNNEQFPTYFYCGLAFSVSMECVPSNNVPNQCAMNVPGNPYCGNGAPYASAISTNVYNSRCCVWSHSIYVNNTQCSCGSYVAPSVPNTANVSMAVNEYVTISREMIIYGGSGQWYQLASITQSNLQNYRVNFSSSGLVPIATVTGGVVFTYEMSIISTQLQSFVPFSVLFYDYGYPSNAGVADTFHIQIAHVCGTNTLCPYNGICNSNTNQCECASGYSLVNTECIVSSQPQQPIASSSSSSTGQYIVINNNNENQMPKTSSSVLSIGEIVGIAVGGAVFICFIIVVCLYVFCYRSKNVPVDNNRPVIVKEGVQLTTLA